MPRDFPRSRRIEDQIQRILSDIIRLHVRDPRLNGAIITAVDVSRDLGVAWVHFTSLDPDQERGELEDAFVSAVGFLRGRLARELTVRQVPELRFRYDDSIRKASAMDQLIDEAVSKELGNSRGEQDDPESEKDS